MKSIQQKDNMNEIFSRSIGNEMLRCSCTIQFFPDRNVKRKRLNNSGLYRKQLVVINLIIYMPP